MSTWRIIRNDSALRAKPIGERPDHPAVDAEPNDARDAKQQESFEGVVHRARQHARSGVGHRCYRTDYHQQPAIFLQRFLQWFEVLIVNTTEHACPGKIVPDKVTHYPGSKRNERQNSKIDNVFRHNPLGLPDQHEYFGRQNTEHDFRDRKNAQQQWHVVAYFIDLLFVHLQLALNENVGRYNDGKPGESPQQVLKKKGGGCFFLFFFHSSSSTDDRHPRKWFCFIK